MRHVCIRVYRLEIQSVMLVFSSQLCELLPLQPSHWFNSPPLPCVNKYAVYTYTVCKEGGGVWSTGPQTDKHLPQSPFSGQIFLDDDIFALLSMSLIFLRSNPRPL
jgi:hypothetical protein